MSPPSNVRLPLRSSENRNRPVAVFGLATPSLLVRLAFQSPTTIWSPCKPKLKTASSWLAGPSALGALDFVSTEATIVGAATVKSPVGMVDDVLAMIRISGDSPEAKLSEFRDKMNFDLRDDLAASLGSDFAFALDGPVLPMPSWKIVVEVNDQQKLQNTLQLVVGRINQEAAANGKPGVSLTREDVDDRAYYTYKGQDGLQLLTVTYTYAHGDRKSVV